MRKLFAPDSAFMRAMASIADLIIFNLLFLLCALPVVSLGASLTALHTMTFRMSRHEQYRIRDFFAAFRDNFKQATVVWLILLMFLAILWVDYRFLLQTTFSGQGVVWVIFFLLVFLWTATLCWVFPLLSQFDNKIKRCFINALLFSLSHAPRTFVMAIMLLLPFVLFLFAPEVFFKVALLWPFLWASFSAYIGALLLKPVFMPYRTAQGAEDSENNAE